MKRFLSLGCLAAVVASIGCVGMTGGASAAGSLPTLDIALHGADGVSVSGSEVAGAVNIHVTFAGSVPRNGNGPSFALLQLNNGATIQQALRAVQAAHGDPDAVAPYGRLLVSGGPGSMQTTLTPGNWVALNVTANGRPGIAPFTVTQTASPAALPTANATETAVEFGFRGPATLHRGTILREVNDGYLVHMIQFIGAKTKANAQQAIVLLREGKDNQAAKLLTHSFFGSGPVAHGGMQQELLAAKAGYYIEVCFMDTQDGREHAQLGMLRLVKVVG